VEFLPTSILDKWIYFFKHAEEGEHFPSHLMQEVTIHEALDEMKSFNWTEEELLAYEKIEDEHYAYVNNMEIAKAEARAEGMEKGIEKGRMEEKFEVARNLKQLGLDDARIIVATGLTDAQLKAL
jgi:predicted transposase/invertase (TIGR01784 family)